MKYSKNRKYAIALALATIPLLMGCGANTSATQPATGVAPGAVIAPGVATGACIPLSAQIPFSGANIYFDSAGLSAGAVPGKQTFGSTAVGGAGGAGQFQAQSVDGMISINVMPANGLSPLAPNLTATTANITGILTLSAVTQQDIQFQSGGLLGYNNNTGYNVPMPMPIYQPYPGQVYQPTVNQQTCVSGIALDGMHYNTRLHSMRVFLYLNGTNHGYQIYF